MSKKFLPKFKPMTKRILVIEANEKHFYCLNPYAGSHGGSEGGYSISYKKEK